MKPTVVVDRNRRFGQQTARCTRGSFARVCIQRHSSDTHARPLQDASAWHARSFSRKSEHDMVGRMPEYWMLTWPIAGATAQVAKLAEAAGWDGLLITDTQCLAAETFVQLALCVAATQR